VNETLATTPPPTSAAVDPSVSTSKTSSQTTPTSYSNGGESTAYWQRMFPLHYVFRFSKLLLRFWNDLCSTGNNFTVHMIHFFIAQNFTFPSHGISNYSNGLILSILFIRHSVYCTSVNIYFCLCTLYTCILLYNCVFRVYFTYKSTLY